MNERAAASPPKTLGAQFKRVLVAAVMLAVATMLVWQARSIEWRAVGQAVRGLTPGALWGAAGFAALSYVVYGSFDLFGRHYLGRPLKGRTMMTVAMVSYAFSLNLGTLVGGVGFRYRLYARRGLGVAQTLQVVGLAVLTNWLAYPLLLGLSLLFRFVPLPSSWQLPATAMGLVGGALCLLPLLYLAGCAWAPRRRWSLKGHPLTLPGFRFATLQLSLSTLNWLSNAAVIYLLMPPEVPYLPVLAALLISATAGIITHMPGGLGVTEAVFLTLLGAQVGHDAVLGAVLAYRAIYYLAPLALAVIVYLDMEATAKRITR